MKRRPAVVTTAAGSALVLALTACGGEKTSPGGTGGNAGAAAAYNAGVGHVFSPSDVKGGTLRMANAGDWDSLDPADNYYGYEWTFLRTYGRTLVMFDTKPGEAGLKLVPDMAESLGQASADAKTWTYKLKKGIKFEDGTPVTSKDVKYGVERSLDKDVFVNGPTYFNDFLDLQGYTSPYKDKDPEKLGLKAIETPDDQTIIFHLKKPFGGFDYFAQLAPTVPVPRDKDKGIKYKEHVVSTGPYMFETNQLGKKFTMVRNPNWDAATDPVRKPLADRIEVQLNVNAEDVDNRMLSGDLDMDVVGTGLQPATQGRVLGNPDLKKNADLANQLRLWYVSVNPDVAPLDNVHCRKAVLYATDHQGYQSAFGGPTGGDIATNMLPPLIPGAQKFDLYNFGSKQNGDIDSAKQELQQCGQPNGFTTNYSYRAERPKEKAVGESLQQALAKVGIKVTLKPYPQGDYFSLYAGKPDYAKKNGLGLLSNGWGADWPDGFGFISQITDSRTIRASGGNYNLSIKLPEVDKLLDDALLQTDTAEREKFWSQIDRKVMENALVLPGVWAKTLLYRPTTLTNVYVSEGMGGYYDYVSLGVKK